MIISLQELPRWLIRSKTRIIVSKARNKYEQVILSSKSDSRQGMLTRSVSKAKFSYGSNSDSLASESLKTEK